MKPVDRQKMCAHCEGRIAVEATSCPYCGMPLIGDSDSAASFKGGLSSQESLSSLYPPPYSNRNFPSMKTDPKDAQSKFKAPQALADNPFAKMPLAAAVVGTEKEVAGKEGFMPLIFVLLGSNLLTLGLMQAIFSEGGFLRLEWNSRYWFYYCLVSIPLLYLGMKKIKQMKEES
jgi:hypothetical protein